MTDVHIPHVSDEPFTTNHVLTFSGSYLPIQISVARHHKNSPHIPEFGSWEHVLYQKPPYLVLKARFFCRITVSQTNLLIMIFDDQHI